MPPTLFPTDVPTLVVVPNATKALVTTSPSPTALVLGVKYDVRPGLGDVVPDAGGSPERKLQIDPVGRNIMAAQALMALCGRWLRAISSVLCLGHSDPLLMRENFRSLLSDLAVRGRKFANRLSDGAEILAYNVHMVARNFRADLEVRIPRKHRFE